MQTKKANKHRLRWWAFMAHMITQRKAIKAWNTNSGGSSSFLNCASGASSMSFPLISLWPNLGALVGSAYNFQLIFQREICQYAHCLLLVWSPIGLKIFLNKSWHLILSQFQQVNHSSIRCHFLGFSELTLLHVNLFKAEQLHWLDNSTAPGHDACGVALFEFQCS